MGKMLDIVLSYPKLAERIGSKIQEKKKTEKNLKEIAADFSKTYISSFQKILDATLPALYDGINLDPLADIDFKKIALENNVVMVPNHQSHADYIALNYMVYKKYKFPLYVAGGINLNIFPIGTLFRKSGCFFIRRSFANDINYKLTLEAYLYYLLHEGKTIEFFFEGGRSRSGKLLPPRYGLYQMLIEAHAALPEKYKKKLIFMPVSIVHELVPEQKSLARELEGGKKKKESAGQLLKIFKLFSVQMGSVHISLGNPIAAPALITKDSIKKITQDLAFDCFREVGKNMMVTPSSLLALIMLNDPDGTMKWEDILKNAKIVLNYCNKYNLPVTKSLGSKTYEAALERAVDRFINSKKINVLGRSSMGHVLYTIRSDARSEMLYFKNTILHHFLLPWILNLCWINIFNGNIENVGDLKRFFLSQRNQLKHEFYLPETKEFISLALKIISDSVGREMHSLEACMEISRKELYEIASKVGVFSKTFTYISAAYYISVTALKSFLHRGKSEFSFEDFMKETESIFSTEIGHGKLVRYRESYAKPLVQSSLKLLISEGIVKNNFGTYEIFDTQKLENLYEQYANDLREQMTFNLR